MKHSHPIILGAGLLALATQAQAQQRPNVIVLVADDLGYGDLSCYGANRVSTPRVDSIANSGVRFTDAHAVASTSTPARYSLLTGEYCFRRPGTDIATGDAGLIIRPDRYTLARLFQDNGYVTAAIGNGTSASATKRGNRIGTRSSTSVWTPSASTILTSWRQRPTACPVSTSKTEKW